MRVGNIIKTGVLAGMMSVGVSSCKKAPFQKMSADKVSTEVVTKLDSLKQEGAKLVQDTTYKFFGYDTLKITRNLTENTDKFVKKIDKEAKANTPKVKVGEHFENMMIPKRGGGFDLIPTMKTDFEPAYINQKAIVTSDALYTTNGKDMYVPVEYFGKKNPKAIPMQKKK